MTNKLATDRKAIGDNTDKFYYIYSYLKPKVKDIIVTYIEKGGKDNRKDPNDFLEYLHVNYLDPNLTSHALDRLRNLK